MFASTGAGESRRRAEQLAARLGLLVAGAEVEARDGLAVIRVPPSEAGRLAEPALRRDVLALAKAEGFSHVAVELA